VTGTLFPLLPNPDPMGLMGDRLSLFWSLTAASFVGKFGWMSYPLPRSVYGVFFTVLVLAALGWGLRLVRGAASGAPRREVLLCFAAFAGAFGLYVSYSVFQDFAPMSRYLFTALPGLAVLVALGVEAGIRLLPGEPLRTLEWSASCGILLMASIGALVDWAQHLVRAGAG